MNRINVLTKSCLVLAIIGAVNWGLIGFFNWNLINAIFGGETAVASHWFSRVIYALVGLCGVALIALWPQLREVSPKRMAVGGRAEVRP